MKLLLTMFGPGEALFAILIVVVIAAIVLRTLRTYTKTRNLKKQLNDVTRERDELRDKMYL